MNAFHDCCLPELGSDGRKDGNVKPPPNLLFRIKTGYCTRNNFSGRDQG
jgi:hypothetical protein